MFFFFLPRLFGSRKSTSQYRSPRHKGTKRFKEEKVVWSSDSLISEAIDSQSGRSGYEFQLDGNPIGQFLFPLTKDTIDIGRALSRLHDKIFPLPEVESSGIDNRTIGKGIFLFLLLSFFFPLFFFFFFFWPINIREIVLREIVSALFHILFRKINTWWNKDESSFKNSSCTMILMN